MILLVAKRKLELARIYLEFDSLDFPCAFCSVGKDECGLKPNEFSFCDEFVEDEEEERA
jgi:hypothetical protein